MKTSRRQHRGLSLIELLIGSTIAIGAIAMAGMAFLAQNKALQAMDFTRIANASARDTLLTLEGGLRTAGWGVDPRYAIDLLSATPSVDRTTAPDDLSVIARNPMYQWLDNGEGTCVTAGGCYGGNAWPIAVLGASPVAFTITLQGGQVIEKGRLLQAVCLGGEFPVIVTSSATYSAPAGTPTTVTVQTAATASFPYNDTSAIRACHGQTGSALFLVDRARYFVTISAGVPWLMLDPGIDLNANGTLPPADAADLIPIAKDVEDFQVAYMLNGTGSGPDSDHNWILADAAGVVELPTAPADATTLPTYVTPLNDASRLTAASANVRGIRLSLVFRSTRTDSDQVQSWLGDVMAYGENRSGTSANGGRRRRYSAMTHISLRNLESTRSFTF
jgi:type IV pilus assembly protein PilW